VERTGESLAPGPPFEDDVEPEILFEEKTYVVASKDSPWSTRKLPFAFADLADEPWALPIPGTFVGALFADAFRDHGIEYPPKCFAAGNIYLHCELVASGSFLAVIPGSVLRLNAERYGPHALPVESPVGPSPVGILRLKDRPITQFVQLLIDCLRRNA